MLFNVILGVTVFTTFAMMVREGIWSNTILLFQIILSGLTAFGVYQPLTILVDEQLGGEYTYALDIVLIWAVYCATLVLLKVLCELLSKTRMRFRHPIDDAVGPVIGLIAGVFLAGFVGATLHVAPLPRDGLGGGMDYSEKKASEASLLALDIKWLNVVEAASAAGLGGPAEFKTQDFLDIYGNRRSKYEGAEGLRIDR